MIEPFTAAQEERVAEIVREALDAFAVELRAAMAPPEKIAAIVRGEIRSFAKLEA